MYINFCRASTFSKAYGLRVWDVKGWLQDHHVLPEEKPGSNSPKNFETMLKGYSIAAAKFQEIPLGYACVLNHMLGVTPGQKIQAPLTRHA